MPNISINKVVQQLKSSGKSLTIWTLLEFWKIISKAWTDVSESYNKHAWKKLCPQFFKDLENITNAIKETTDMVVKIAHLLNLDVSQYDIN